MASWDCSKCTLHNKHGSSCSLCSSARPASSAPPLPPTSPTRWVCAVCTFAENHSLASHCAVCQEARTVKPPSPTEAAAPTPAFGAPPGHARFWVCTTCTFDENGSDSSNCTVCSPGRPSVVRPRFPQRPPQVNPGHGLFRFLRPPSEVPSLRTINFKIYNIGLKSKTLIVQTNQIEINLERPGSFQ